MPKSARQFTQEVLPYFFWIEFKACIENEVKKRVAQLRAAEQKKVAEHNGKVAAPCRAQQRRSGSPSIFIIRAVAATLSRYICCTPAARAPSENACTPVRKRLRRSAHVRQVRPEGLISAAGSCQRRNGRHRVQPYVEP